MLEASNSAKQVACLGRASPHSGPSRPLVAIPTSEAANVAPSQNPARDRNSIFFNLSTNAYASINNVSVKFFMAWIISTAFVIGYF